MQNAEMLTQQSIQKSHYDKTVEIKENEFVVFGSILWLEDKYGKMVLLPKNVKSLYRS